jgi:AcrR family transcriptional regulator
MIGYVELYAKGRKHMARKRLKSPVRQGQIIDAARKLVVKYGSEHVTIGRIAREVGISEGAIYRHFKSKREVLSGLADNIADDLFVHIDKISEVPYKSLEFINTILHDHLSKIQQRRGVSFLVIAEIISLGDKKLNKKIYEIITRYINTLKELLIKGTQSGEIRKDIDTEASAILLFSLIQGLVNIWALSNYSIDVEDKYAELWNFFSKAILQT